MLNEIGLFCVGYIIYHKSLKYNYMYIIYIKKTLFYIHDNYMNITKIVLFKSRKLLSQLAIRSAQCNLRELDSQQEISIAVWAIVEKKLKMNILLYHLIGIKRPD